jgi:phosphopantetheinyl transferase
MVTLLDARRTSPSSADVLEGLPGAVAPRRAGAAVWSATLLSDPAECSGSPAEVFGADLERYTQLSARDVAAADRLLAGRRAVHALAGTLGLPWPGFAPSISGVKPRFASGDADLSVSHSGDVLLVALVASGRVGIDVETRVDAFDSAGLIRRFCTPAEIAQADQLTGEARRRWLARLWSAKEAVAKLDGRGIRADLRESALGHLLSSRPRVAAWTLAVDSGAGLALTELAEEMA